MDVDVYVESNFVLELALSQEQCESCERIVELAEAGKARLIVPAYSLIEPHDKLVRGEKERTRVSRELDSQMKQLSRSKVYQEELDALQKAAGFLVRSLEEEKERFRNTVKRLLRVSEIIPLHAQTFISASEHELNHDLSLPDSIVYASVLSHLTANTTAIKCFLNRNSKDFDDPDIEETLKSSGCKMLFSFEHGHGYITSQLRA